MGREGLEGGILKGREYLGRGNSEGEGIFGEGEF